MIVMIAGEPWELAPSPCGPQLAVATHDLRLLLIDTRTGVVTRLDRAAHDGGIFDVAWSADGNWLAYAVSTSPGPIAMHLSNMGPHRTPPEPPWDPPDPPDPP